MPLALRLLEHRVFSVAPGKDIRREVQDFFLRERSEQTFRHRRDFRRLDTLHFLAVDCLLLEGVRRIGVHHHVVAAPAQVQSAQMPAASAAPAQEMRQAIQSFKGGNLEDAVTRLQKLRAAPLLTPEQRIAVNDAIAAVMNEVTALAEKGDAHAIQAVEQFRRMQTERR